MALLLFKSFSERDECARILGLFEGDDMPTSVEETPVVEWHSNNNARVLVGVPRAPGGVAGYAEKARKLIEACAWHLHHVYIFHRELHALETRANVLVHLNTPIEHVARNLGLLLAADDGNASPPHPLPHPLRRASFRLSPARIHVRRTLFDRDDILVVDNDDTEFQEAVRLSLQAYEAYVPPAPEARTLAPDWAAVLHERSDPLIGGGGGEDEIACVVCMDSRASICFVDCAHQVVCDECVRIMWTRSDLARQCPVCRTEVTTRFTRPGERKRIKRTND
jgi:hypothetical protein